MHGWEEAMYNRESGGRRLDSHRRRLTAIRRPETGASRYWVGRWADVADVLAASSSCFLDRFNLLLELLGPDVDEVRPLLGAQSWRLLRRDHRPPLASCSCSQDQNFHVLAASLNSMTDQVVQISDVSRWLHNNSCLQKSIVSLSKKSIFSLDPY